MASETHARLRDLFLEFADLASDERARRLDALASVEPVTAARLRTLLGLDDVLAETTVQPVADQLSAYRQAALAVDIAGLRIGAFVIRREISAGGMGRVFLAERDDGTVEQRVAVKLIRPDLFDDAMRRRFHFERQALASLEHRDIAGLIDAGELPDGTPYLVMEFVDGEPVTDYADRHSLDLRARLALVRDMCDAVAYAHRRLIVHRDIKPGNVMVDASGAIKLLDFGIARPLRVDIDERTATANRFWSPYHAAPELWRGEDIGVACDVYGIGMILYELLAGRLPFDVDGKTPGEIEQAVLNVEAPPPSVRCNAGAQRARQLRGDLDAIAGRCLRKLPQERYSGVEALVQDIDAYLAGRPVAARRGRTWYVARKFVARHRIAAGAAAAIAVTLVASGVALWNQYRRTELQRDRAQAVTGFLIDTFSAADPAKNLGVPVTAKQLLDQAAARVKSDLRPQPALKAELMLAIAQVKRSAGYPREARELFDLALQSLGESATDERDLTIRILLGKADLDIWAVDADAFRQTEARLGTYDLSPRQQIEFERWRIGSLSMSGESLAATPRWEGLAVDAAARLAPDDRLLVRILQEMAQNYLAAGQLEKSRATLQALLADQFRSLAPDHPDVIATKTGIARVPGNDEDSFRIYREVADPIRRLYGEDSINYANSLNNEAAALTALHRPAEAYPLLERALAIYRQRVGDSHSRIAASHLNLASASLAEPSLRHLADGHFRESIAVAERAYPEGHFNRMLFRTSYCMFLVDEARYSDAVDTMVPGLAEAEKNAELKEFDPYPIALACRAVGAYGKAPSTAGLATMRAALAEAKKAAVNPESIEVLGTIAAAAAKLDPETKAPPAAK